MDNVKISLPKPEDTTGVKKIKSFLKQLELCVHHLQKAVDQMEADEEISEGTFIIYRFPFLETLKHDENYNIKIHQDDISDTNKMQDIEIEIVTI